jgi:hypothetical protein
VLLAHAGVAGPQDEAQEHGEGIFELRLSNVPCPSWEALQKAGPAGIEPALSTITTPVADPGPEAEAVLDVRCRNARVTFARDERLQATQRLRETLVLGRPGPAANACQPAAMSFRQGPSAMLVAAMAHPRSEPEPLST